MGAISEGPGRTPLVGTFQTAESFVYQDDVGGVVLRVCQTVPFGVLCFLPSYAALDRLVNRWKVLHPRTTGQAPSQLVPPLHNWSCRLTVDSTPSLLAPPPHNWPHPLTADSNPSLLAPPPAAGPTPSRLVTHPHS